ncbi:MAG: hypothetical protein JWL63_435 [Rhodocyclales bacterium]|nr:hypothetical protein [Rhodocyclales bacterium]
MLQLGMITSLTSLVHQLHPSGWLVIQVLICAVTLKFTGGLRQQNLRHLAIAWCRWRSAFPGFVTGLSPWALMALIAIGGILALSAVVQLTTPIHAGDEKMYHASRVLYWIQHQTVLPFATHNIRQTLTPFGSELFFLWSVLFTKTEAVGRLVFWLAYPLAATGQYLLLRSIKLSRTTALIGVLILISTPLVASSAIGLKPELWSVVTLLGVAYWFVSICLSPRKMTKKYFFLGVFAVLSISIRAFPVAILPSLVLLVFWTRSRFPALTRLKFLAAGLMCGAVMSSLLLLLASNFATYHHPLGPPEVQRYVKADITPQVMFTHAVRFAFVLLELPDVPAAAETRSAFNGAANKFISAIGAGAPLFGEDDGPWPGKFVYSLPERSTRFSLWGLLWIPSLCIAVLLLIRNLVATWPRVKLTAIPAQTLLVVPLLGAILFGARWMSHSDVPTRFLIGPYSLLLPIGIAIFAPYFSIRKFAQSLLAIVILYSVYQPISAQVRNAVEAIASPISATAINQPFEEALGLMQPGSRILFVGEQSAPDYPLFSPGTHYSNAVIPWGTSPFDAARMRRLIDSGKVTHVLIQSDEGVSFLDAPILNTGTMVRWLAKEPGLKAIPLMTRHMRLYSVGDSPQMNEQAFQTAGAPSAAPLIAIGASLQGQVGIDPMPPKTPWPIENFGGIEGSFLWVGQGQAEGIEFGLWSRQERTVDLQFDALPGPSLWTPERRVMLVHNGVPVGDERTLNSDAPIAFHVRLHAGRNVFSFFAFDAPTVKRMPNGDARNLIVGLHEIRVEAGQAPIGNDVPSTPPEKTNSPAIDARNTDLTESARMAAEMIRSRQQIEGYWLTYYTSAERFELPSQEMNTFATAMMVDLLSAKSIPAGLEGNLARARTHLRNQIEVNGLVRYHGRPDAPTIGTLGCAITPDTDDTALVWRIAPGAQALRPTALATLKQYRTSDGLYKTWLGQRADYQCIDPGSDPNPADVAIQMHVLMLLAQADPAAARSLCGALRQTIDQDRVWVYYRKAPLIPVLRQADLRAAGCPLQVPPSRSHSAIPGQNIWLDAAQMLQRLEGSHDQLPSSAEVLELLRKLSGDEFSRLRLNPPMFYHNDLTASVRRFYWSKDLGYAIWLRLYSESVRHGFLSSSRAGNEAIAPGRATRK